VDRDVEAAIGRASPGALVWLRIDGGEEFTGLLASEQNDGFLSIEAEDGSRAHHIALELIVDFGPVIVSPGLE
jgi:hypothetical protein